MRTEREILGAIEYFRDALQPLIDSADGDDPTLQKTLNIIVGILLWTLGDSECQN